MLQKVILKQFMKMYEKPTYQEMVSLTGLERTRLFRISNGCEMKMNEFEIFLNLLGESKSPLKLFLDCYLLLDRKSVVEIENSIKRKMSLRLMQRGA